MHVESVQKVLGVIEEMASSAHPDDRDKIGKIHEALAAAANDKPPRLHSNEDPAALEKKYGETIGRGVDPAGKRVAFTSDLLSLNGLGTQAQDPCHPDFLTLLNTMLHEGVHMFQDCQTQDEYVKSREQAGADTFVARVEWKENQLRLEVEAYRFEERMKREEGTALAQLIRNIEDGKTGDAVKDDVPKWAWVWAGCDLAELRALSAAAGERLANINALFEGLTNTLVDDVPKPAKTLIEDAERAIPLLEPGTDVTNKSAVLKWMQNTTFNGLFYRHGGGPRSIPLDSLGGKVGGVTIPGVRYPQAIELVRDSAGFPYLVVTGFNRFFEPSGSLAVVPFDETAFLPFPPRQIITFALDLDGCQTVCEGDPRLGQPTSLVTAPDGRIYLWDPRGPGLFLLVDGDGNGVPESIDFTNRVRAPSGAGASDLDAYADASWAGDGILLRTRFLITLDTGGGSFQILRDRDGDGLFEDWTRVEPDQFSDFHPILLTGKRGGARTAFVYGVRGHRIEIRARPAGGGLETERVIGRGAVGGRGSARIALSEEALEGQSVRAVDLSNGRTGATFRVDRPGPEVSEIEPTLLNPDSETAVVVSGNQLDRIEAVLLDGRELPFRQLGDGRLRFTAPAVGRKGDFQLVLRSPAGSLEYSLLPRQD